MFAKHFKYFRDELCQFELVQALHDLGDGEKAHSGDGPRAAFSQLRVLWTEQLLYLLNKIFAEGHFCLGHVRQSEG